MQFPKTSIDVDELIEIAKNFKIKELYLFGSVLREEFSENSDIDILIVFHENSNYSLFEFLDLKEKLELCLNRKVDLIEKDGITNPYRRKEILSTSRRIYVA
ncbi:MAG: nucleotidyltransferase domain-containing protein [Candidatus Delongbacteria bacterium]|nr:nucleotidyltransferase domain-containing protein [Candidatus Delongbacteria bacterium]MBN2834868.1 nucleotidyltransferase domain-containing protein [Candidatus Delongbacteria bacterium]